VTPLPPPVPAPHADPPAVAAVEPAAEGTLTVTTRANAAVYLDGKLIEHGSFAGRSTENGIHELIVKAPGYAPISRSVTIDAARETRLALVPSQRAGPAAASQPAVAAKSSEAESTDAPGAAGNTVATGPGEVAAHPEPPAQPASTAAAVSAPAATPLSPPPPPEPPRKDKPEPPTEEAKRPAIDIAATRAAARSQLGPIQQCYERARMDDASLKGNVTAQITVAADGSVANVRIVSSTLSSPPTERCIAAEIARWQLPKPGGGAAVSFTYPFVFE
jgi:hypothetical protein